VHTHIASAPKQTSSRSCVVFIRASNRRNRKLPHAPLCNPRAAAAEDPEKKAIESAARQPFYWIKYTAFM
jgi:hypothetical protein